MIEVKVFLGGEGRNELGSRSGHPAYQNDDSPGVIQTLLLRVQIEQEVQDHVWQFVGGCDWKNIPKFRAKGPTPTEERNVLGLVVEAKRTGAHAVAFTRDGDDCEGRDECIDQAIHKARQEFPQVEIIGAWACPGLVDTRPQVKGRRKVPHVQGREETGPARTHA